MRDGDGPGRDRGRVPVGRVASASRSRRRSRRSRCRSRSRDEPRSAPRRSAIRCSRCFGSRGSPASGRRSTRTCGRRTPGCRDVTSTGSKASCGVAGSCEATGPSRSPSSCAAVGRIPTYDLAVSDDAAVEVVPGARPTSCCETPMGRWLSSGRLALARRSRGARRGRPDAATSWRPSSPRAATWASATCSPPSTGRPCGATLRERPAASPSSTSCAPARGATTPSSSSGSSRARCRDGRASSRSSTTDARRALDERHGGRLVRPDQASRDRYLFATACTRPKRRLVLVRQAVGDEGTPRESSPFWEAVRDLFDEDDVRHHTVRRPLSAATRADRVGPDRARATALRSRGCRPTHPSRRRALARENGWERRARPGDDRVRRDRRRS